jgi:hypothetical protein
MQEEVQRHLGPRGFLLASKGFSELPTDEALVYLAVEYALSTGRPTIILTGDADVGGCPVRRGSLRRRSRCDGYTVRAIAVSWVGVWMFV